MYGNNPSVPAPAAYRRLRPLPAVRPFNSLEDWKGELLWKAMDPIGYQYLCRILLSRESEDDIQLIFSEVKDQICGLMFDKFGRYVIHHLCQVCDEEQMNQLVSSVTADIHLFMVICLNSQGSEAMTDFIDSLKTPKQMSDVISVLQGLMAQLVNHRIGWNIIQHCFNIFPKPAKETEPILDAIADIFFEMATNQYGSRLLGQLIRTKVFLLEKRHSILSKLIEDVHKLPRHPFGSHVVQDVIKLRIHDAERDIYAQLRGDFALLSMDGYAHCVVLSLMKEYKEKVVPQIYNEIKHSPNFLKVLMDPYGKDVIKFVKKYTMKTGSQTLPLSSQSCHH